MLTVDFERGVSCTVDPRQITLTKSPANDAEIETMAASAVEQGARLRRLSWLMDNSIRLPTGHRIGIDGIIGLVPGIGDLAGALVSIYMVAVAARIGVPKRVLARMGVNVVIETVVGSIPLVGDVFDFAFKANVKNCKLVERHLASPDKARAQSATTPTM